MTINIPELEKRVRKGYALLNDSHLSSKHAEDDTLLVLIEAVKAAEALRTATGWPHKLKGGNLQERLESLRERLTAFDFESQEEEQVVRQWEWELRVVSGAGAGKLIARATADPGFGANLLWRYPHRRGKAIKVQWFYSTDGGETFSPHGEPFPYAR